MADTDRIKRNLGKMIGANAPEADIDAYLKTEGFDTPDAWRAAIAQPAAPAQAQKPVAAAMSVNNPPPQVGPGPRTEQMPTPGRSWADVPAEAGRNFFRSAGDFASAVVEPFLSPIETGKNMLALGQGVAALEVPKKMVRVTLPNGQTVFQPQENETPEGRAAREQTAAPAVAVGQFFKDRYGSEEGLKNTLATDPVGFLADSATVLSGGGAMAARAPGMVGKVGAVAARAGGAIDPLSAAGSAAKGAVKLTEPLVSNALGTTTGAGTESIRAAGRAGLEGGEVAKSLTDNMRGNVPIESVVDRAKEALDGMRRDRAEAYKAGKVDLSKDKTVLDFQPIEDAVGKANEVGTYKGVVVNRKAGGAVDEINGIVADWKKLDPAEYHTPEGLDALKRTIGDLRDSTEYGTPARVAADRVYNAVKGEIQKQAPGYAGMMEDYAKASDKIKEATKAFSLGDKASVDTATRKLQSITRNNAQTNYGQRLSLMDELAAHDAGLPYAIAGQSLNALAPRGLVARGGGMLTAGSGLALNPAAAMLPAFSPRLVGEAAYAGGRAVNALSVDPALARAAGQGAFQAGRLDDIRSRALALRSNNTLRR